MAYATKRAKTGPKREVKASSGRKGGSGRDWTFLSNHAHVMLSLAMDPDIRIRDIALQVGLTERAVQRILQELADDGVVTISRHGRRNSYQVNSDSPLRHPLEAHRSVNDLVRLVVRRR